MAQIKFSLSVKCSGKNWFLFIFLSNNIKITTKIGYFVREHLCAVATDLRMKRVIAVGEIVTMIYKYLNIHVGHEREALEQTCLNITYLSRTKHVKMAFNQHTGDLNYYLFLANKYFTLIHTDHYVPANHNPHHQAGNDEKEDDIVPMTISYTA